MVEICSVYNLCDNFTTIGANKPEPFSALLKQHDHDHDNKT